jgi:hypothetical protein
MVALYVYIINIIEDARPQTEITDEAGKPLPESPTRNPE